MTDYELLSLYSEYAQLFATMVAVYISVLFAYLLASYIVAEKLTRIQFWLVSLLFLYVSFDIVSGVRVHGARTASLQSEILRRIEAQDSQITFVHPSGIPMWLPDAIFATYLLISLIAVVFALRLRRKRK